MLSQLLTLASFAADPPATTVFHAGLANTTCYRIPSIVQTGTGTLVAFAEARVGSCGDSAVHTLASRRSTDHGKTWASVVTAAGNVKTALVGNPNAFYVPTTKRIILTYVKHTPKCGGDCGVGNGMTYSEDDGKTWSKEMDLSKMWGKASGSLPGPGMGLVLSSGPKKGRLLAVAHHSAYQEDYVVISDDAGKTWAPNARTFPKMDEAQMTQLTNGTVMLNMRHKAAKTLGRGVAFSNDGGSTFGPITFEKELISPVCQGSTVTFGGSTYFSNPASTSGRNHCTVRKSADGVNWPSKFLIEAGASAGYSALVGGPVGGTTHGGILFESTAGGSISFALFPLAMQ